MTLRSRARRKGKAAVQDADDVRRQAMTMVEMIREQGREVDAVLRNLRCLTTQPPRQERLR